MKSKKQKAGQLRVKAALMSSLNDAELVDQLFGGPALLPGEEPQHYKELVRRVRELVKPADLVDYLLVDDAIYWTWEVYRLRRIKLDLYTKLEQWQDDQFANAEFRQVAKNIKTIEQRIAVAEGRRDGALREIERRRDVAVARLQLMIEQAASVNSPGRTVTLYTPRARVDLLRAQLAAVNRALEDAKRDAEADREGVEEVSPEEATSQQAATEQSEMIDDEVTLVPQETAEDEPETVPAEDNTLADSGDEVHDESDETA